MVKIKRFSFIILLVLLLISFFNTGSILVNASDKKIENEGATYRVKNKVEECYLGYGIKYQRDIAYSSVKPNHSTGNVAGYGSTGPIVSNQEYLQQVNWLEIAADSNAKLIPYASLSGGFWNVRTVRDFAAEYETKNPGQMVIAAVNGDWFAISDECKASVGVTISNGEYYKSFSDYPVDSNTLVIDNNAKGKRLSDLSDNTVEPVLTIYNKDGEEVLRSKIDKVNDEPIGDEIALYYANRVSRADDYYYKFKNVKVSNAWVSEKPSEAVSVIKDTFYGKGTIKKIDSEYEITQGKFAIKTNNANILSLLSENTLIRCQYEYVREDLKSIENAICFPYEVVVNGKEVYPENTDMHVDAKTRKPRTMIGQKEDGTLFLAQVDGRNAQDNRFGMCQMEMAALLQYYGCVDAWKFDGGGSSTMIIRKQSGFNISQSYNNNDVTDWHVVNSPSDGSERSDGNCLLVVVEVPEVELDIVDVTANLIVFQVNLISLIDKYSEYCIMVNGKPYKVIDGKATVDGLKASTKYECFVYGIKDDKYYNLGKRQIVSSALPVPDQMSMSVTLIRGSEKNLIEIYYRINNKASVKRIEFMVDERVYLTESQKINVAFSQELLDILNSLEVSVTVEPSKYLDSYVITFKDIEKSYSFDFIIEEIKFNVQNSFKDIFVLDE